MAAAASSSSNSRRLEGKVAIITGGASGLGEAAAHLFVANGASVLVADIQDELGQRVVQALGESAEYKHCDVTVEEDVAAAVAYTVNKWGKLDIMYSNAGILGKASMEGKTALDLDMAGFDRVIEVNVRGSALAVKHAAAAMVGGGQKRGSIICTASISAVVGGQAPLDYTVSKHALLGLVRAAASDLGKYGIRVNAVSPGAVMTPLSVNYARDLFGDPHLSVSQIQAMADSVNVLANHTLTPVDVANAALFLASDDAAFVSGHNLVVDGALTATRMLGRNS